MLKHTSGGGTRIFFLGGGGKEANPWNWPSPPCFNVVGWKEQRSNVFFLTSAILVPRQVPIDRGEAGLLHIKLHLLASTTQVPS